MDNQPSKVCCIIQHNMRYFYTEEIIINIRGISVCTTKGRT